MYDASFTIIIFGDESHGKRTFTQRFLTNLFVSDSKMTIGVDFEVKSLEVDKQKVKLQIWDFGREERFRFLFPTYARGALGGLFLYDVSNYSTLAHMGDWLIIIRKELKAEERFPILAVGIVHDEGIEREISAEEGKKMAKSMKLDGFIECNLQTGKNVEETFEALTRLILAQPRFCHKCQKEFMFGEFLKHPCFTAGDVKYSGAIRLRGDINRGFNYLTTKERRKKGKKKKKRAKKERKIGERRRKEEYSTKDEEYIITYTRHLEKRLRNLETENQLLDAERLRLEQEVNSLRNEIDRYKKSSALTK